MDMQGSRQLAVTQQQAWEALNDPEVLKVCIPGCDSIEATGEGAYALTNAGIGIRRPDRSFALTLWGKNVFDERYYDRVNLNNATAPATVRLGQPLTFGVTLSLRFS